MGGRLEFPYFFVLGVAHAHVYQDCPTVEAESLFYIPVEVQSDDDRSILDNMQTTLEGFGLGRAVNEVARFIHTSALFTSTLTFGKMYPVLEPITHLAIYQTWGTVQDLKETLPPRLKFRKTQTIDHALIYLLYKGNYQAMEAAGVPIPPPDSSPRKPGTRIKFSHSAAEIDRVTDAFKRSNLSTPDLHTSHHAGHYAYPQQPPFITPVNSRARISSPVPPPWAPSSSSATRPAQHTPPEPVPGRKSRPIFRNIRSLSGIVGCEITPTYRTNSSMLGTYADNYLWAHGYQPGSVHLIQQAYERASGVDDFANELASSGVPVAEGQYIFSLIDGAM